MNGDSSISVNEVELEADGDLVKFNGIPFSGVGIDPFPNGEGIEYSTQYKDGLVHGFWRKFYSSGQLAHEITCYAGLKHGHETLWFPDGIVQERSLYEYGIKISSQSWNKDGTLKSEFVISPNSTNFALLTERRRRGWNIGTQ